MKNTFLSFAILIIASLSANAQLRPTLRCPNFEVDVLAGTVNDLLPKSAVSEIQATLPCFTATIIKDSATTCAGVFYKDRDINFYTDRRYIEIGEKFKGKITPALMGASRTSLFRVLGHPKLKDTNWDAFQMGYGTLVLYYNKAGKINKIQQTKKTTDDLKLCN